MKKIGLLQIKLQFLLRKRAGIVQYNLSGAGWQDFFSSSERSRMYSIVEDRSKEIAEVESEIVLVAKKLMESGYTKEELLADFKNISKYLPKEEVKVVKETQNEEKTIKMHI